MGWELAVGATLGFTAFIGLAFFLRYCVYDKKCAPQEQPEKKRKPKVRKIVPDNPLPWQVGQQPYQGERPPQPNYQQPMPMGGYPAPPMGGDPAYPPSMPQGGPAPAANPFKSASYGH